MNESKKNYLEPVMTCIELETDVITTSIEKDYQTSGEYDGGDWGGLN